MTVPGTDLDCLFESLSPKQQATLPLLVAGMTTKEAAKKVNINPGTIANWRWKNNAFQKCEGLLRYRALEEAKETLRSFALKASIAISKSLESEDERVRLAAAKFLVDRLALFKSSEIHKLGNLISELDNVDSLRGMARPPNVAASPPPKL